MTIRRPPTGRGNRSARSDVLEMRAYLAEYQGDVRGLFGAPPDESEPGGGAAHDETDTSG